MERKINIAFWFFWGVSMVLSLTEAVTYSGFIVKHTKLNLFEVLIPMVFIGLGLLVLSFVRKNKKPQKNYKIITIFSGFLLILYVVLKVAERITYANFVFSKLHVQPSNLLWPFLISFFAFIVMRLPQIIINFKRLSVIQSVLTTFVILIIGFNIYKTYKTEWWAFQFIITHPMATYEDKMKRAVGSTFYDFTQFINAYTPDNSLILLPPQAFPWPQSGNGAYMRYFVYPRGIGNGDEYLPGKGNNLNNYDYVLLAWGETSTTQGVYTHGWPKFDVPAEKIIFMNKDGFYGGEIKGDYHYKDYNGKEVWGVIKIRH